MASVLPSTSHPPQLPYQPMRISVERYHAMLDSGVLGEEDRVELLRGVIVEKMTKNPLHSTATRKCDLALAAMVPRGWHVQNQEPIVLADSEPEPDIAITRGSLSDYESCHPRGEAVGLVLEVANSSVSTDRFKASIYAEAGISVYWIVNLNEQVVEVYSSPVQVDNNWKYAEQTFYRGDDAIPVMLAGECIGEIKVSELI